VSSESYLGDSKWLKELLLKNFSRVGRDTLSRNHFPLLSVVVCQPDIVGVSALPTEDHSPLLVYSDAVKALQVTL
jgi:hypothetical protein